MIKNYIIFKWSILGCGIFPFSLKGVGTQIMYISLGCISWKTLKCLDEIAVLTNLSRSASTIWMLPLLIVDIIDLLVSTPATDYPLFARSAAVGRPI